MWWAAEVRSAGETLMVTVVGPSEKASQVLRLLPMVFRQPVDQLCDVMCLL